MNLDEYDYTLPRNLIAQRPSKVRGESRLMVVKHTPLHDSFRNIGRYLAEGDVLVLNDSKVVRAKLVGRKPTGGRVELLLVRWNGVLAECLINGKKIRPGSMIEFKGFWCKVVEKTGPGYTVRFNEDTAKLLERDGKLPLPQYIKETLDDATRYQTVYANTLGSLAAPTAGLHFTRQLLDEVRAMGVEIARVTLHIGPATFLPLRDGAHPLMPEYYSIDEHNASLINQGIEKGSLIPVGTTAVKAIESSNRGGRVQSCDDKSNLFISPGYRFKTPIKAMITNFHLPRSTLLLLVCALFGRDRILNAYSEAIKERYRFYSLGDAMLIER